MTSSNYDRTVPILNSGKTPVSDGVAAAFFENTTAPRVNTDAYIYNAVSNEHPGINVTVVPQNGCDLKAFAQSTGKATAEALDNPIQSSVASKKHIVPSSLKWTTYQPPFKRLDGGNGGIVEMIILEKLLYRWEEHEFLVYTVNGRDGMMAYPEVTNQYIISNDKKAVELLITTVGSWTSVLHDEIWVFDQGWWQKSRELFEATKNASWKNVILNDDMKKDLIETATRFFDSRDQYRRLSVPWKRGVIFYGPPGNGKTISIKATMNTLYQRNPPIPTLYVKTLTSFAGPEYSISQIFEKARQEAPCYLVFEDLDSLVGPNSRSFFLNAVDGLSENEGILMIGSTNHLDRLDPGIAKRPSRFDRRYHFPNPIYDERVQYCHFWQSKLSSNKDIEFPDKLCPAIATITDDFSFAYMQEAFVSTLLKIARDNDKKPPKSILKQLGDPWELLEINDAIPSYPDNDDGDDDLDKYLLWREIKVQIKSLKSELSDDKDAE